MRLIRLGDNAHMLETSAGAVLFSYETLTAVLLYDATETARGPRSAAFRSPAAIMSTATRAHLQRFYPLRSPPVLSGRQFADLARRVLNG